MRFTELHVRWIVGPFWGLTWPLTYTGQVDTIRVPEGFVTDFASVPKFMRGILDNDGPYLLAAIVHDYLLTLLLIAMGAETPAQINSRDADGIFRRIMREEGIGFCMRWTMWAAVRVAALFSPYRAYGRGFLRDLPKVLAVAAPAALVLGPYALVTLLTRGLLRLLRF